MKKYITLFVAAGLILATMVTPVEGVAVRTNSGFNTHTLARNDDLSTTSRVPMGFTIDFWGSTYSDLWVNNNISNNVECIVQCTVDFINDMVSSTTN